jgi:hypothetical protein
MLGEFGGTDYARACAADGWVSTIPVGSGTGVVLGADDFAYGVQWLHLPGLSGVLLTIPVYADHNFDSFLVEELQLSNGNAWQLVPGQFHTATGELMLLSAASPGADLTEPEGRASAGIGEYIPCTVAPGSYSIAERTIILPPERGNAEVVLCRLERSPGQNEPA